MSHQSPMPYLKTPIEAGREIAQLRHVLRLVEELAGRGASARADDAALDEAARITSAYEDAYPIIRRRFDTLAAETATWSAAGVEALLAAGDTRNAAAARRLADELARAIKRLTALLRL